LLVEFGSVVDALRCATELQAGMAQRNVDVPIDRRIEFRIGINVGDVVVEARDIFVGGESPPALRRAARLGDAWYPIGSNNKHLLDTLPRYQAGIDRLRRLTTEAGRDPASVALTYRVKRYGEAVPERVSDGTRRLFSGTTADIVADLRALRDLGVSAVDIDFERPDAAASIAEMRRFKEVVLSHL
jgi:alkanesulfonate monooxygenase SsuD/methylene tetrahydromethanopterin reductase-like flavin-dependent oxidoreductase (luciferase family)